MRAQIIGPQDSLDYSQETIVTETSSWIPNMHVLERFDYQVLSLLFTLILQVHVFRFYPYIDWQIGNSYSIYLIKPLNQSRIFLKQ